MPSLKFRVKLPTEPNVIGNWDDTKLKSSVEDNNESGTLLSQDLHSCTHDFYQTRALFEFGKMQNSMYDESKKLLTKIKKEVTNPLLRRFIIMVGSNKFHEDKFNERSHPKCGPNSNDEDYPTFKSMLHDHYLWCFTHDENSHIKKALDRDNVHHVIIYNRFYRTLSRNKPEVEPIYYVVAAATFVIAETCSVLLYMGVTDAVFSPKTDFLGSSIINETMKAKMENYRNHDLGAYMISLIEKITYAVVNNHTVIAQVNNHAIKGAVHFYLKQYFAIVHKDHPQLHECRTKFGNDIFQDVPGLVYMIAKCPLYIILPKFMNNLSSIDSMYDAIVHGAQHILKINLSKDKIIQSILSEHFNTCSNKLASEEDAYFCPISESETGNLTLSKEKKDSNDDFVILPNIGFWKTFVERQSYLIITNNTSNQNYKIMALLLFQDEQRYSDIRCFFIT